MWDGLKTGMNILNDDFAKASSADGASSHRLSTLFILTDGMPNVSPPRGHIPMLKSYLDAHSTTQQFSISTFGFGYSIDTELLLEIAQVGGGGYGFIPDPGMVGTVFIHATANAYSTYAPRAKVDIEVPDGVDIEVMGRLPVIKTSWGVQIDAGDIQFGQSRDYILVLNRMPATIAATARYRPVNLAKDISTSSVVIVPTVVSDQASIEYHTARLKLVEILFQAKQSTLSASIDALESLQRDITTSHTLANHSNALAVAQDVSGQCLLGLESAHFSRWGRHYFPSLALAHLRQQCGNFRDPGLQPYGRDSPIFIEERDKLDAAFDALPPPKPSVPSHSRSNPIRARRGQHRTNIATSSMSLYNSSSGPCFAGHCLVEVSGGMQVKVEQLKRGMEVTTLKGPRKVAAIVRTSNSSGELRLCRIGQGLEITPWHPIRRHGQGQGQDAWVFPTDRVAPETLACNAVYSILLVPDNEQDSDAHSVLIGGVWCVTLGHGLTNSATGDIRTHPFLGNYEKVLQEISSLRGFHDAGGVVESYGTRRTMVDGRICGFVGTNETPENMMNACELKSSVYV